MILLLRRVGQAISRATLVIFLGLALLFLLFALPLEERSALDGISVRLWWQALLEAVKSPWSGSSWEVP